MYTTPFLDLPPLRSAGGRVRLPGSKSISNRVLLLAALSSGCSTLHGVLDSDDTQVMLQALRSLGCGIELVPAAAADTQATAGAANAAAPEAAPLRLHGLGGQLRQRSAQLFLGNAGTAMRPLTAALALLAATQGGQFELSGVARMHERPIGDLVDALRQLGCPVQYLGQPGYPPLRVGDGQVHALRLDEPIRVRGDVSSQFLTALLLALPLVSTRALVIEVVGELISKPYIEITLAMLARFGVAVQRQGWQRFVVAPGSRYQAVADLHVEADASSASYFLALGAIAPARAGSDGVWVEGVGLDSIQGDIRFVEALQAMGARVDGDAQALRVRRGCWPLRAIDLDCNHIPDAAMTLAPLALYADGACVLRNIASWRVKETDRIAAMACELRQLGAKVEEGPDWLRIHPLPLDGSGWRRASIHTYDDHRMAMCFALAAFNPARLGLRIEDPKCVAKTFPDFFETWFALCQADAADIPVLCLDGPTASGKGTLAAQVAARLGYHRLDSGLLYRALALAAERAGLATDAAALQQPGAAQALAELAAQMPLRFAAERAWMGAEDVSAALRSEAVGMAASRVAALPSVRSALLDWQRRARQLPGLVADGRDMGTVVFPDAALKVFLTASAAARAQRRWQQLTEQGQSAIMSDLLADLQQRDERDRTRAVAPLQAAPGAHSIDNTGSSIEASVQQVLACWEQVQGAPVRV